MLTRYNSTLPTTKFRRSTNASATPFDNTSNYLRCILNPMSGPAGIPDYNMTTSHPKSVELTQNVVVLGSGQGLFVYLPHSNGEPVVFFVWVTALNRYVFLGTISYNQELSLNYTLGRFVAGAFSVKSATTSGTFFNVSGTINAAAFQEMPDITTLTYNQITAFKRNDVDVVASATVQDGVISLAIPDGDETYVPFNTPNTYESENVVTATSIQGDITTAPFAPGWSVYNPASAATQIIFNSVGTGFLPPNVFGPVKIRLEVNLGLTVQVAGGTVNIGIAANGLQVSAVDWTTVTAVVVNRQLFLTPGGTPAFRFAACEFIWPAGVPLESIDISVTSLPGYVQTPQAASYMVLSYELPTYYQQGAIGPGTLIAFNAVSVGQTLTLGGVGNYEVVPNSNLSKDITTSIFNPFNPAEMELVGHYLSNSMLNGVKFVWRNSEYEAWLRSGKVEEHSDMNHVANATGFGEFIRSLISKALPIVGTTLGGPAGGMVGSGLAGLLAPQDNAGTFGAQSATFRYIGGLPDYS